MIRFLSSINVPVAVRNGMCFRPNGYGIQKNLPSVLRLDPAEIRAMRAQFAKQRFISARDALAYNRNTEPRQQRRLWRHGGAQSIRVCDRRRAKGIELVCCPEVSGELLDKLRRRIYPIELFKLRGKLDFCESLETIPSPVPPKVSSRLASSLSSALRSTGNLKS